jgi:hypothetical protein
VEYFAPGREKALFLSSQARAANGKMRFVITDRAGSL